LAVAEALSEEISRVVAREGTCHTRAVEPKLNRRRFS